MRTDRQRDIKKLIDGFRNFAKAPENVGTTSKYGYTIYILFTHQQMHILLNLEKFKFILKYT